MSKHSLTITKWLPLAALVLLLLQPGLVQAKPKLGQDNGKAKTEFKFGPAPLPEFSPKEGDPKLENRPGVISASTSDKPGVLLAHIEKLDENAVIKILGDAVLKQGEASISLQVNGVTRSRANLSSPNAKATLNFASTLPKGEGDLVIELGPKSSLTINQLRMEKLL